ncbi:MAG: hypothetical protein IPN34_15595 [Planctomycetes bacterium]|nr:hypothetical protein [Planctomycetota bacterium]
MPTILRYSLSALLWLLLGAGPLGAQEVRVSYSSARHIDEGNPDYGDRPGWIVTRIVDARTGAPISGAELLEIKERTAPTACELWSSQRDVADENGFARLYLEERRGGSWFLARAPGYGARCASGGPDMPTVELWPAQSLPVLLRDHLDRPVADVRVGVCLGCGHTPDIVCRTTDERGFVELSGVDPFNRIFDLYVTHPLLDIAYDGDAGERLAFEPPYVLHVARGATIRGTLADAQGVPLGDAMVGFEGPHRGPWTRTREDGSFSLSGGMGFFDTNGLRGLRVSYGKQLVFFEFAAHRVPHLRLPPPTGEIRQGVDLEELDPISKVPLRVLIEPAEAAVGAFVRFVGPLPERLESQTEAEAILEHALPEGRYEVELHALGYAVERSALQIDAGESAELVLRPKPLPAVSVRLRHPAEGDQVSLVTEHASFDVTERVLAGQTIGLPGEEFRFVIETERGDPPRYVAVDRARALAEGSLELRSFEPAIVHGRVVDPESSLRFEGTVALIGRHRLGAWAHESSDLENLSGARIDAWFAIPIEGEGLFFLVVQAKDADFPARIMPVCLPARGVDVRVDLGDVIVGVPAPLTLELPEDASTEGHALAWQRIGWMDTDDAWPFPFDHRGRWYGPDLAAGDVLRWIAPELESEDEEPASNSAVPPVLDVEVRWVLEGSGPWNLRVPTGEVLLDLRTEDDATQRFSILVGTQEFRAEPGSVVLRYLAPGPQRLVLSAEGHQTAIVDVEVSEERRVEAKIVLPRRS